MLAMVMAVAVAVDSHSLALPVKLIAQTLHTQSWLRGGRCAPN